MSEPDGCAAIREAVSAELDGEPAPLSYVEVAHHLDGCAACRRFADEVPGLARRTRVGAADAIPDLTSAIVANLATEGTGAGRGARRSDLPRSSRPRPAQRVGQRVGRRVGELRVLVALAGAAQLVVAVPMLLGVVGPDLHLGRDLGALQIALGFGLLLAAAQPRRAPGVLPVLAVVTGITAIAAIVDVVAGTATIAVELTHLTELVGVGVLWALSRRLPTTPEPATSWPNLRMETA